ncbi:MAG: thiamine phosphate synthase [Bryobacteraceae bacterium]|nr:thiamine phosphate synthase [Bryobacteraceae bacterium]
MTLPPLYPILDAETAAKRGIAIAAAAEAMLEGGARILQLRHKGHFSRGVFEEAERAGELCRKFGAVWIVDDRADIARLLAAGVHLGQDDLPPAMARRILGPEALVGFSTHNEAQLKAAEEEGVDYLALGPVFPTGSKRDPDPSLGLDELRRLRALTRRPLVAIGGITRDNALSVLASGADSVAVIGDLFPEPCAWESLRRRMEEWQQLLKRKPV